MKFKFGKSLKNDYGILLSLTFFIIGIVFIVFFSVGLQAYRLINIEKIIQNGIKEFNLADAIILIILGFLAIISLILFIKRLCYLKSFTNEECKYVTAKVVDIDYIKDRCGVDVEFIYEGNTCKKHFALMNNSQTKYIHMDSEVELVIKNGNPKKSLIAELYFDFNG